MANLAQISNLRGSQRGAALLAMILSVSPFLRWLDSQSGWEEGGTVHRFRTFNGSTVLNYRPVGGAYTPAGLAPDTPEQGALAIGGFAIDVDQTHKADESRGMLDIQAWLDDQLAEEGYEFAKSLEAALFLGDGTADSYVGLKTILDGVTNMPGFSITGVINAASAVAGAPDSLDISDDTNWDAFTEALILWIQHVENAKGLVMSPKTFARMYTIAKKQHLLGQSIDQFGQPVSTFANVPMIATLQESILHDEDDDGGPAVANTTSLYIMSPGEKVLSVVSNSGLEFEDYEALEEKQSARVKAEVRLAWKIQRKRAIRRVRNLKV